MNLLKPIRWLLLWVFGIHLTLVGAVRGHDLWLKPRGEVAVGKTLTINAISGVKFPEGDHAPDPAQFPRRVVIDPSGQERPLAAAGREPKAGLMHFTPTQPGIHVFAVETKPRLITLSAEQFNEYLVGDGLPHIFLLRSKEGTLNQAGKERYRKSPKLILRAGQGGGGDACRPVGLPLEIVPLQDPLITKPGTVLPVRVLFESKPLAEANLGWDYPGTEISPRGTARTNAQGQALIPVDRPGWITIRLTHMTRPKAPDYEWESFWTTLTFDVSP